MPSPKSHMIYNWKKSGLICDDYNALYETYIETTECQHCQTEFTEKNWRCMDHDHETGLFRKIVCHRCNARDSYIKYPNGFTEQDRKEYQQEYQRANKEKILAYNKEKIECECGSIVSRSDIARHNRTKRHSNYKLNNLV